MNNHHFEKRMGALQSAMAKHGWDAFISVDPSDNAYLTGFHGSTSALLVTCQSAKLLCDFRYIEQAAAQVRTAQVVECAGNLDLRLAEQLEQAQLKHIAFEPSTISVARHQTLETNCSGEFLAASGICSELRSCKDPGEIERIAAATALAEESLEAMLEHLKPGVSECALAGLLEYEFRKRGAQGASFDSIVLFGDRSALPHGKPGDRALKSGDIILVDCGCVLDGYCSDLTRTFVFCRILDGWFSEIYETTRVAQEMALQVVRAGVSAQEVDAAARGYIMDAGYGDNFGHGTGHGVGLEVHEAPRINTESRAVLKTGMVVTVEPGIYLPGQGGVRIEDLVVVTDDGCDNFNRLPKELRIL
ncbi:MAG: aminopeptidase P family protein [Candidatus Hydrogenedentes bacterium]|nr:aminopeptidase P family protein [Candidatus Hydrogenedentota bacterium]